MSHRNEQPLRVVNVAAYRFAPLDDPPALRVELQQLCRSWNLKGTILLSKEGVNLFVAGDRDGVDALIRRLRSEPLLADLETKESFSAAQPFNRMLVRLKKEIIAFGVDGVDPRRAPAPTISPKQLESWLDEGREVLLLDTRNDYEIAVGAFRSAVHLNLQHFREFPLAMRSLHDSWKRKPVVMYCTGGIRCEKAGPYMLAQGFEHVYQLDGGILNYFAECGGRHFRGDCFVFDQRVALAPDLRETAAAMCFACQAVLTPEEQQSSRYRPGESCPHCHESSDDRRARFRDAFQRRWATATRVLPGAAPAENRRPLNVPARFDRCSLLEMLCRWHPHKGEAYWRVECRMGRLHRDGVPIPEHAIVRAGERIEHVSVATTEPRVNVDVQWLWQDDDLLALNKPAPLPMHPGGRFHRNTLAFLLRSAFPEIKWRAVHRLDANTSGVVLCARTRATAAALHREFQERRVDKVYLAEAAGCPTWSAMRCETPIAAQPSAAGVRLPDPDGLPALTEFQVLERRPHTTLLLARPLSGRTNQIRAHLWSLGHPVVGDASYLVAGGLGVRQALAPEEAPMRLHAKSLEIEKPGASERIRFEAPDPPWV